jgi:hypothetical protein
VHRLFLVVLLAGLTSATRAQIVSPFVRLVSDPPTPSVDIRSLSSPFYSTPPRNRPLRHLFTQPKCLYVDALDCVSRDLSGSEAVDCGRVRLSRNPKYANDCVLKALSQRKSFRGRYDQQGMDADAARAIVMTSEGKLIDIDWVGNTWDASDPGYVNQHPCIQPARLKTTAPGELECSPLFGRMSEDHWPKLEKAVKVNVKFVEY